MNDFRGITAFVRTAEHLSFSGAARALGISASGVSNAVSRLEQQAGVRLLNRSTRSVSLTPDGALFFERCRRGLQELEEARISLTESRRSPRGQLSVNLPRGLGRLHVAPRICEFVARHPAVTVMLALDDEVVDTIEEGWDVVVRLRAAGDSSLVARRLGETRLVTCASPAYLERHGTPEQVEDLRQHNCLRLVRARNARAREWPFRVGGKECTFAPSGSYSADNNDALIAMAAAGAGIVQVHNYYLGAPLRDGVLLPLLPAHQAVGSAVFAMYPSARQLSPKVRAFIDYLAEILPPAL